MVAMAATVETQVELPASKLAMATVTKATERCRAQSSGGSSERGPGTMHQAHQQEAPIQPVKL